MTTPLRALARAKVNLSLLVTGKRPDGYHLLDSVVVFAETGDILTAAPAPDHRPGLSLEITGPQAAALQGDGQDHGGDNLVLRAARALAEATRRVPQARITLEKHLPVASGIGGGSADAAAALDLLARLWGVEDTALLMQVAARIGADVPVCLQGRPARMQGIGERLTTLPPPPRCGMVLVNPGLALSTPDVFRARSAGFSPAQPPPPSGWPDAAALAQWLRGTANDLQSPAIALCPTIAEVLHVIGQQPHCLLARMSGSGATCFGLFPDAATAAQAATALSRPGWWHWGGAIAP